jgi:hypothetical protein
MARLYLELIFVLKISIFSPPFCRQERAICVEKDRLEQCVGKGASCGTFRGARVVACIITQRDASYRGRHRALSYTFDFLTAVAILITFVGAQVKLLSQLSHPFVLGYIDSFMHKNSVCIVTEYCESGDLYNKLKVRARFDPCVCSVVLL